MQNEDTAKPPGPGDKEWQTRVDLAALYRLAAFHGWDEMISGHISARLPGYRDRFLLNPYGMHFEEITASSLIVMDFARRQYGDPAWTYNRAGFEAHRAVQKHREDAHFVIHLHTRYGVAVSCQKQGLLPLNQSALSIYSEVAYHDFEGIVDAGEEAGLARDLGKKNALIMRNHGTLACGINAGAAWQAMFRLEKACEYQILAQSSGAELSLLSENHIRAQAHLSTTETLKRRGEHLWPALLRKLDRIDPGYRD